MNTPTLDHATVLVVEDNVQSNNLFCKMFEKAGYTCKGHFSIRDTLGYLQNHQPPALIILDLELGDGSGERVLEYLAQQQLAEVKVIVVSAEAYRLEHQLKSHRVDHVLLKPISPRGLTALARDLLEGSS
jgi:CheY-like chemotaxis protein